MEIESVLTEVDVGAKVTTTVQLAPAPTVPLQVPPVPGYAPPLKEKGELIVAEMEVAVSVPEFVTVNAWSAEAPTTTLPKSYVAPSEIAREAGR